MKLLILFAILAVAFADQAQYQLHIPDKCEDVLAVKVCIRLRNTAGFLKLKSEEVKKGVLDAYSKGKKNAAEIETYVRQLMIDLVVDKKCEDYTNTVICDKLRKMAADAKVKATELNKYVMSQLAILRTKECEDFMDADKCNKIDELVAKLKIKINEKKDMIVAAYLEAREKGTEQLAETYNKIKEYVMATRCEDMFNPDLCVSMRKYAEKTKVALPRIMATAFDLLKKGMSVSKALIQKVYDIVDYFYDCEDIFDDSSCQRIKSWAATLTVKAEEVEILVRKYVRIFIEKATTITQTIKDFVKSRVICKIRPSSSSCTGITSDSDDEVAYAISKRATGDEWKQTILEILKNKFSTIKADLKKYISGLVLQSKSKWDFMIKLAKEIKSKSEAKFAEYVQFVQDLMAEIVTY